MFKKSKIHQTPEERLNSAIESINEKVSTQEISEKVEGLKQHIDNPQQVVRKLDEVKSANLATNILLKKIHTKVSEEMKPVELLRTIKGDRGERGEKGEKGDRGEVGEKGESGIDGKDGLSSIGIDGKDGSPDTPDEIVEKVNAAKKKIAWRQIKDVPDFSKQDTMNQIGYVSGGANQMVIQNGGVRLSDYVQFLNFGAGLTASYSNGTILVTANTSGSVLTATGTIDDSNVSFTFTSEPSVLIINGGTYRQTGGAITWSWVEATLTATLSSPVGTSGSLFGLI